MEIKRMQQLRDLMAEFRAEMDSGQETESPQHEELECEILNISGDIYLGGDVGPSAWNNPGLGEGEFKVNLSDLAVLKRQAD